MLRLRPYKSCDSKHIADWIKNEETFVKWGGERFGSYPINAKIIDDKYRLNNGDCVEDDNFYPMTAFDDSGVVGHFIMRYINWLMTVGTLVMVCLLGGFWYWRKTRRSGRQQIR